MNIQHYNLSYLQHCGKRSSLQGIKDAGHTFGYVPLKQRLHWSWKQSEVCGRHKLYRHRNVPIASGFQSPDYFVPNGVVQHVKEVTGKHVLHNDTPVETVDFYTRNAISSKAKRKRASLTRIERDRMSHAMMTATVCHNAAASSR